MKKNVILMAAGMLAVTVINQSCSSTQATTIAAPVTTDAVEVYNGPTTKIDRFVSVEAVADLSAGMTYSEVVSKLGAKPYNVFSAQANGHRAIQYKYRLLNMEVPTDNVNENGVEKGKNKMNYLPGYQDLFIIFDGEDKLEYLTTTEGNKTEQLLRDNNLLFVIKKDKSKYSDDTSAAYRLTNSDAFYPLLPCTTCSPSPKKEEIKKEIIIKQEDIMPAILTPAVPAAPKKLTLGSGLNILN